MKVKEDSEKVGLNLNIQRTKIMASSPITSWQIDGETVETVADFIFLGSKITAVGDWSYEIKRRLLLRRKVMTNLDNILKSIDINLSAKVCLVKAMVFPVVMYGFEEPPYCFSYRLPTLTTSCLFDESYSDRCEVTSHGGFASYLWRLMMVSIFSAPIGHL